MNSGPVCGPGSASLIQVRSSGHCSIAGDDGTISGQKIEPAGVHANPSTARSVSRCWIASATVIVSPTHVSAGLTAGDWPGVPVGPEVGGTVVGPADRA